jgi:dipeptidyl aminopeptidase/acylaminoacyl peptidase
MKRCPQCNRVETDETLKFCRVDGATLVGASSGVDNEAGTAKLGSTATEIETSIFPHTTDAAMNQATAPTTVFPAPSSATTGALAKQKSRRSWITVAVILIALIVLAAGVGLYKFFNRSQPRKAISFASAKLQRLTTTGKATRVAISPDGKYVVHVQDEGGQRSLWMRQTVTQSNVQIVAPAAVTYDSLAFSPDGNYVYYVVSGQEFPQRVLFQLPTLGGAPRSDVILIKDFR